MAVDIFELFGKLKLDKRNFEEGLSSAKDGLSKFESVSKKALSAVGNLSVAAVKTAAKGVSTIVKKSVSAYGEYEQLVGGVETLFGDSAEKVIDDSKEAFKTAGMSMNEYMETSIQSAASLISSLDGDQEKASKLMNMSITDMADNVNKMGTTMEGVQNAYRGFSRGNFTMLDNLALGFSGTKQGMEDLLKKAEEISKKHGNAVKYSIDSYADMVEAIHVVQTEMHISGLSAEEAAEKVKKGEMTQEEAFESMGTTAKEAASTLQGSISSMKSAWDNLITGMGDKNADLDKLTNDFADSAVTAAGNLLPILEQALETTGTLIEKFGEEILPRLPKIIDDLAPELLDAALNLLESLLDNLPDLIQSIVDLIPDAIKDISDFLVKNTPTLIDKFVDLILTVIEELTNPDVIDNVLEAAEKIIVSLADGLLKALPKIFKRLPQIVKNLVHRIIKYRLEFIKLGVDLFSSLVQNMPEIINGVIQAIPELIAAILSELMPLGEELGNFFAQCFVVIQEAFAPIGDFFAGIWDGIVSVFFNVSDWFGELFTNAWNGIQEAWSNVVNFFSGIWDGIVSAFFNASDWFGSLFTNAWNGIQEAWSNVENFFSGIWDGIKNTFGSVADWFKNTFTQAWQGVKDVFSTGGKIFDGIKDGILSGLKVVINGIITGINKVIEVPFNGLNAALRGIKSVNIAGLKPFDWINEISVPQIPQLAQGGILKRGQIALLEGQGDEAVIPLSQNTEWIDKVASKINDKSNSQNRTVTNTFNFDVKIANMDANNQQDIEKAADTLMKIIAEKTSRRGFAYADVASL